MAQNNRQKSGPAADTSFGGGGNRDAEPPCGEGQQAALRRRQRILLRMLNVMLACAVARVGGWGIIKQ